MQVYFHSLWQFFKSINKNLKEKGEKKKKNKINKIKIIVVTGACNNSLAYAGEKEKHKILSHFPPLMYLLQRRVEENSQVYSIMCQNSIHLHHLLPNWFL